MNKFLVTTAALTLGVAAAVAQVAKVPVKTVSVTPRHTIELIHPASGSTIAVTGTDSRKLKSTESATAVRRSIKPGTAKAPARAAEMPEGCILFESFEGWDGENYDWVPEGWEVVSNGSSELTQFEKWGPSKTNPYLPGPTDGKGYYGISYAEDEQNEWLISPYVTLPDAATDLTFDVYYNPIFFFDLYSENTIDWESGVWINQQIIYDLKINVREEGGEWVTVKSFADEYMGWTYEELVAATPSSLEPRKVSLADFAGKKVQIAFQYVGHDGDTVFLDNIRIGLPSLALPVYTMPLYNQYWGTDLEYASANFGCAFLPVFTELTWEVYDPQEGETYTWSYNDPMNADNFLTATGSWMSAEYATDYTSEFTTRTNLYYPPTVTASAPGASETSYKNGARYMQMGGKPEITFTDGSSLSMGLLPFSINEKGYGVTTVESEYQGYGYSAPIFGHNEYTDRYWTDYTFRGEEEPGEGVKLKSIINFVFPPESPMVVTGMHFDFKGRGIGENVDFNLAIVPLSDEGVPDFDNPLAQATVWGKDAILVAEGGSSDYYTIQATFDQPLTLDYSYPSYVAVLTGFNSEDIEYFAPMQSLLPDDVPYYISWLRKEITYMGETRESLSPIAYHEGPYGLCFNSFAFNLEGYYPWLVSDATEVEIGHNATEVGLDSYYDGAELTVTAPDWADVTVTGRYGSTVLNVEAAFTETARQGEITLSAPGVSKTFTLKQAAGTGSGIAGIAADDNSATEIYDLSGRKVTSDRMEPGVYIQRTASGKAVKIKN